MIALQCSRRYRRRAISVSYQQCAQTLCCICQVAEDNHSIKPRAGMDGDQSHAALPDGRSGQSE